MQSKYFSILVVPDQTSQVRRVTIPRSYLYVAGGLAAAVMVACMVGVIHYFHLVRNYADYEQARSEYRAVSSQLGSYSNRLDRVDRRLRHLALMERKLRLMTRLEDPERNIAIGPVRDEGEDESSLPEESIQVAAVGKDLTEQDAFEYRKLGLRLERLESESKAQEFSLEELTTILEDQQDLLDSTPSVWPTRGFVTSTFGYRSSPFTGRKRMHEGLDIAAPRGTEVSAPADGVVTYRGVRGGYGKMVVVDHGYGVLTRYGHLSEVLVNPGEQVERGAAIAKVGNTGRSTGDHLHYEVRLDGVPVNPKMYILD